MTIALVLLMAAVELPRIGCWRESDGAARGLYGVPGNLVTRTEEACENTAAFGAPDDDGLRLLPIATRWLLAERADGERYLLYRESQRYELPQ